MGGDMGQAILRMKNHTIIENNSLHSLSQN
jgi:hypothetical protein